MIEAQDVVGILEAVEMAGLAIWLDGGWGVDALLGERRGRTTTSMS